MKQYMNKVLTLAVLLLTTIGSWAGDVTINISPVGAGTVTASQAEAGKTCTLTVTPASGYYLTVDNLSAVTTLAGGGVQSPSHRTGSIDIGGETLTITATDANADPSGVTTYTFTMPSDETLNVEVTAAFQTLIAINPVVTLEGWTYGEQPNTPVVSGNSGSGEVTFTYATKGSTSFSEDVPANAGEYTVKASVAAAKQYAAGEATADFTISKASITFTKTPAAVETLVYTGEAQALITAGEAVGGELQYKLGTDGNYGTAIPSATSAGSYTVYYKVVADANHTDVAEASINVTIGKAAAAITTAPAAVETLVYTGEAQALITAGVAIGGTLQYKLGVDGEYSTTIPTATNAGTYTIYYKVVADANHTDVAETSVNVTIGKAAATIAKAPAAIDNLTYTGEALALITAGEATGGELQYKLGVDGNYGTAIPTATSAGSYTVYYKVVADANHTDVAEASINVTIGKAAAAVTTAPAAVETLVYTGEGQALITAGVAVGGEMQYKLGVDGNYSTTIPTATNAGTYIVYYRVVADANHTDVAEVSINVTIGKAAATIAKTPAAVENLIYTGEAQALITAGEAVGGELQYKLGADGAYSAAIPTATNAGTYTVYYKVVSTGNYNDVAEAGINVVIGKATISPVVKLDGWTFNAEGNEPTVEGNTGNGEVTFTYAAKGGETFSATKPTTAGTYVVKVVIAETANYQGGEATAEFTIGKAAISPVVKLDGWTFNAEGNEPTVEGNAGNGEVTFTYAAMGSETFSATKPTAAGTYVVKAVIAETANYQGGEATAEFTISPAAITLTKAPAAIANLTYTGEAQALITAGEAVGGELQYKLGENGTYGTAIPTAITAGTYKVFYKVEADANHTDVAETSTDVTIGKANLNEVVIAAIANQVYTGKALEPAVTVTFNGKTVDASEYTVAYTNNTNVGEATVTLTSTDKNFSTQNTKSATFTIKPKELTVEMVTLSETTFVYNGKVQYPKVTVKDGEALTDDDYNVMMSDGLEVGTYSLTVFGQNNYTGSVDLEFRIIAAAITLTKAPAANDNLVYTGETQVLITAGEVTAGELQYSLAADGQYSTTIPTATNAGTYTVYYKVVADDNYTLPEEGSVEVTIAKATPELEMTNESMTLDAHETAKTEINGVVVKLNGSAISGDFAFTYESSDENVATVNANGGVQAVGVGEAVITVKGPIGDANLNETSVTYTVSVFTSYGISIYKDERSVAINNDNRNDVFGDGTVKFDGRQTLILEDAHFTGTVSAFITTSLEELKIFLKGNNTFEGPGRSIETSKNNGTLTFTTEGNTPGTVTMKNTMATDTAKVISGFSNILFEQNLTVLSGAVDQSAMMIGTPVAPIVDKNDEEKTVDVAKVASASTETLSNTTIDNVLYTLKEESDGTGDKVDEADNCIVLASTMIDDDVDETVTTLKPGTDEFAQAFQGLTFMVPAGTGKIIVNVKTGEEGVLNVKIGDDEPYAIEDALDFTDFEFPYACAEATYVYIYNASKVVAAAPSHRAGKKTSITVGVRTVGVQASETQASNAAASAVESGEEVVENSEEIQVSVSNGTAAIDNLGVVDLPADFFADMAYVNTIDLRKTSISGMVVSRSAGVFKNVSKNTFIYLPSGNNTEESNVVFGKICPSAVLDADMPESESFGPADAFTAKQVVLDRIFKKDETATVYLPFAIDLGAAAEFGTFYTFEGVENGKVKIEEVKTDLMANVPYIFKSKDDDVQIAMKAVKVSMPDETAAAPARRAGTEDGLYGCYKHQTSGDGTLYKMVAGETIDDLQFVRMTAGDVVKPFQAYLKLNGDQADSIGVTGGTTTGICNVMVTSDDNDDWQSMSGLRLQKKPSAKGVYINKGKKVVVK